MLHFFFTQLVVVFYRQEGTFFYVSIINPPKNEWYAFNNQCSILDRDTDQQQSQKIISLADLLQNTEGILQSFNLFFVFFLC